MPEPSDASRWWRQGVPLHRWVLWRAAWLAIRCTVAVVLRVRITGRERIPDTGGHMMLANHATFWDFMLCFWGVYRPAYGIGSEQVFRLPVVGFLLKQVNGIPYAKGAKDGDAVRQLVAAYERGGLIGMFPEGERSWTGEPLPIKAGTGRLVKSLGCPVIYCQVTTGFLQHPRWAVWPRFVPWRMTYSAPEHFSPDATVEAINAALARGLAIDPSQIALPAGSFGFRLAEGLPRFLWACPACLGVETLAVLRDRDCVGCSACERRWRVDLRGDLSGETPDTESLSIAQARVRLGEHFTADEPVACEALAVTTVQRGRLRRAPVVRGAGRLTDQGVEVLQDGRVVWSLAYTDMRAVLLQFRSVLQVRVDGANLQLDPRGQSTLRWHHFLSLRRNRAGA